MHGSWFEELPRGSNAWQLHAVKHEVFGVLPTAKLLSEILAARSWHSQKRVVVQREVCDGQVVLVLLSGPVSWPDPHVFSMQKAVLKGPSVESVGHDTISYLKIGDRERGSNFDEI